MNVKKMVTGAAYCIAGAGLLALGYVLGELRTINNCSEATYDVLRSMEDGLTNVRFEKGGTVMTRSYLNDPREVEED